MLLTFSDSSDDAAGANKNINWADHAEEFTINFLNKIFFVKLRQLRHYLVFSFRRKRNFPKGVKEVKMRYEGKMWFVVWCCLLSSIDGFHSKRRNRFLIQESFFTVKNYIIRVIEEFFVQWWRVFFEFQVKFWKETMTMSAWTPKQTLQPACGWRPIRARRK